jgi:hypothetical protein
MSLDTELPLIIVVACMFMAIVVCAPLFILNALRRRSPDPAPEYVLLMPTGGERL